MEERNWGKVDLKFPDCLRGKALEMGIDEAGRGPVLGPMVYGCAFAEVGYDWPESVDDSKKLTPEQREENLTKLYDLPVGFGIRSLSAVEISAKMLSRTPTNLNVMSHTAARSLVQAVLDAGLTVDRLYVDTIGPPETYQKWLQGCFPSIKVTVSKKADAKWKVVGAASINAKVLRDKTLENFKFDEGDFEIDRNWGSGYPSDPNTKSWLAETFDPVFGWPSVCRFSWGSVTEIFKQKKAVADFDYEPIGQSGATFYVERNAKPVLIQ